MEHSTSREAKSQSASSEIPRLLWRVITMFTRAHGHL